MAALMFSVGVGTAACACPDLIPAVVGASSHDNHQAHAGHTMAVAPAATHAACPDTCAGAECATLTEAPAQAGDAVPVTGSACKAIRNTTTAALPYHAPPADHAARTRSSPGQPVPQTLVSLHVLLLN